MVILLKCRERPVVHFGLQCASWVRTSAGSTKRILLAPMGDPGVKCVAQGNLMVSRCLGFAKTAKHVEEGIFVV